MNNDQLGANTSCIYNVSLMQAIEQIRDLGFRGITLLGFANTRHRYGDLAGFWFRELSSADRQELKGQLASFDRRAIHAPFSDMPLVSHDPRIEQLARSRMEESIEAAEYLGCDVVVLHANSRPNYDLPEYWDSLVAAIRSLGEYAADRGVRLGLETGFPRRVDQFVDLLEAVGHHAVGATLDCGHMARYVEQPLWRTPVGTARLNEELMEMVRQLGPLTIHCQLHDVAIDEWADHRTVGQGGIRFEPFLAELQSLGYGGMLEFELEERDGIRALKESQGRIERILRRLNRAQRAA